MPAHGSTSNSLAHDLQNAGANASRDTRRAARRRQTFHTKSILGQLIAEMTAIRTTGIGRDDPRYGFPKVAAGSYTVRIKGPLPGPRGWMSRVRYARGNHAAARDAGRVGAAIPGNSPLADRLGMAAESARSPAGMPRRQRSRFPAPLVLVDPKRLIWSPLTRRTPLALDPVTRECKRIPRRLPVAPASRRRHAGRAAARRPNKAGPRAGAPESLPRGEPALRRP